ncbi:MAG: hypothetical protein HZA66_18165 [Rhodopseudomonas palustris]|uniref:Uncharacterized protein n=1 Tax=Rhodopseudomonas palustris TaxID=1076 RepID=A0A933RZ39_RHOPL|nr:hypothetical protein [Rhodopseudomonas palustris]
MTLASRLTPDLASDLERKYFWWEPIGDQPRSDARILAQAMSFATFAEGRELEQTLGPDVLVEVMLSAAPGWIDPRSWEFWRGRLQRATGRRIPETPPQRVFDAEDL